MSDPAAPPFTQAPLVPALEIQYNCTGRPWFRDTDGQWRVYTEPSMKPSLPQAPLQGPAVPAQSAVQHSATYNFSGPSAHPPHTSIHLDPRFLPPLPPSDDHDLYEPPAIAKSRGLQAAPKVADSRNFEPEDTNTLLDIVQKELPLGPKGWASIHKRFSKWAHKNSRPDRAGKSLETKYKQLLKTKKPTGDAICPPEIKRAHRIEEMINQRAGTHDLSDSEFDGGHASSDDISTEILDSSSSRVHTAVAHRALSPPLRRNGRMNAPDLVNKLSHAFDPEAQKARDAERSQRSFQATQMLSLTQQLCDAQAANEGLRNQITIMQGHTHDVERACDRAELRLEMVEGANGRGFGANQSLWSMEIVNFTPLFTYLLGEFHG
ncbi:hypothetical protein C8J57DRAFT_1472431 [Mycena rebaudengoi]|nr:hypothetical protein C8J57DRAFT_1472431 [Mycena rebaudengoi]